MGNPADAGPAVRSHLCEVFEAVEVDGDIFSFLTGGFFADGVGLVDVVDAFDFEVVGAVVVGHLEGEGGSKQRE